ncbi:MAG TPA: flagellar biosynthetic protein FliO [Rhodopila sp.]|jgi:flagellar protein FliO/FliZ|nr:flagellar biosynthetic protein FliO [Rhodopila sp.]
MIHDITWITPVLAVTAIPLAAVLVRYLRGRGLLTPPTASRVLRLEETVALDPRRRLHLVTCGGRRLIVLTGGPQDISIGWLPEA